MLATQADIESLFHTDFGNPAEPAVTRYLEQAQAAIEAVAGRPLEEATRTESYTVAGGDQLTLRTWPVASITSITEEGVVVDPSFYALYADTGVVRRTSSVREWWPGDPYTLGWSQLPNGLSVVYVGGYPSDHYLYPDLRRLTATIAFRQFERAAAWAANDATGITQESIGSYQVTNSAEARTPSMGELLTPDEVRHIRRTYGARTTGTVAMR